MDDNRKGFKAFEPGLICRGKQYAENADFEEAGGNICGKGMMHYCVNPFDCLDYYPLVNSKGEISDFATVEALEDPITDDGKKFAAKKLHIGLKLGLPRFVKACVDYIKVQTIGNMPSSKGDAGDGAQIGSSGDAARIGSSGNAAQIGSSGYAARIGSSGDGAQIGSSGDGAQIGSSGDAARIGSSGNAAQIGSSGYAARIGSSGDGAQIGSSGDGAQIGSSGDAARIGSSGYAARIDSTGEDAVVCCAGHGNIVKAKTGSWITLSEWAYSEEKKHSVPVCVKTARVDGEIIKADTWYKLVNGEFTEVHDA